MADLKIHWMGKAPVHCDVGGEPIATLFVDGRTVMGPWGNMCMTCHKKFGSGVGVGKGQMYEKQRDGRWLKIQG